MDSKQSIVTRKKLLSTVITAQARAKFTDGSVNIFADAPERHGTFRKSSRSSIEKITFVVKFCMVQLGRLLGESKGVEERKQATVGSNSGKETSAPMPEDYVARGAQGEGQHTSPMAPPMGQLTCR